MGKRVWAELENDDNELWLSPISTWEALILHRKGKIVLHADPIHWVQQIMRSSCSRASSRAGSEPTTLIGAPHNSERGSRQSLNLPLCTQISRGSARPV